MVQIPSINNRATANRKSSNVFQSVGVGLFLDLIEAKKEAYFLDVDAGINPLGAMAFRAVSNGDDLLNFFLGQPLIPAPTVQEVIDNPLDHFRRLMVGTSIDVEAAIGLAPQRRAEVMSGLQERRASGDTLAQVISNAVNADKDTRAAFDTYLINAREMAVNLLETSTDNVVAGLDDGLARIVRSLSEFFIDAAFARPRRSGDGKRVSKQQHEFDYLSNEVIDSYGTEVLGVPNEDGFTHLDVALLLLAVNFDRPNNDVTGLGPSSTAAIELEESEKSIIEGDNFVIPVELFRPSDFSYGNFIDSYHMRRLLAELKKIVQESRLDNITEFLRQNGQTRAEYISNRLGRLAPNGFISLAANEFIVNTCLNPTRPVRQYVRTKNIVEATFRGEDIAVNDVGPLLTFSANSVSTLAGGN